MDFQKIGWMLLDSIPLVISILLIMYVDLAIWIIFIISFGIGMVIGVVKSILKPKTVCPVPKK